MLSWIVAGKEVFYCEYSQELVIVSINVAE